MRTRIMCLSALIAALAGMTSVTPARADNVSSLVLPKGSSNQFGQPVEASVSLTVKVDRVYIRVSNDTTDVACFDQTISAISFKLPQKPNNAHMGSSSATIRTLSTDGFKDMSRPDDTRWNVKIDGDIVTVHAPGQRFTILPDARKNYPKADASLLDSKHNPYITKTIFMEVVFPDSGLTNQLTDLKIYWGHEISLLESNITGGLADSSGTDPELPPVQGGSIPPGGGGGGGPPWVPPGGGPGGGGGGGGDDDDDPPPYIPPSGPPIFPPDDDPPNTPPVDNTPPLEPQATPEPTTLGMLALGVSGLLMRRKKSS